MEQCDVGKLDSMYQLLHEYNFEMNENVTSEFKCEKCEKILIDSYSGSCLCQFCCNCLSVMITNGFEKCPGNTDECKEGKLINFVSDRITNLKISKLVLKCPKQMCLHECELVNMEEHLRVCLNRNVECTFFGMGCNEDKLGLKGMGDHLQTESYNHYRNMIETLMNELKKRDETLKEMEKKNDELIAEMQQEIQRNKIQIKQILTENSRKKDEAIGVMQAAFKLIKMEKPETASQINNLANELEKNIANATQQIKQEKQNNLEKCLLRLTSRIEEVEKWQDRQMGSSIVWTINEISDKIKINTNIYSAIFYSKINPYKMQLQMFKAKGSDEIRIFLNIYTGETDAGIIWPYQSDITIIISNKPHPDATRTLTKYCSILKPNKNSFNSSDPFKFSYKELLTAGLMEDNYFVIQCYEE